MSTLNKCYELYQIASYRITPKRSVFKMYRPWIVSLPMYLDANRIVSWGRDAHPYNSSIKLLCSLLSHSLSLSISPDSFPLSYPMTSLYTHLLFLCSPPRIFLPSLLSLSVRMKKGQCERKNRRVNRGERSRAFYTRYKYLQKCGWNTWNPHEEKESGENITAAWVSAHMHMRPTCTYTQTYNKVFFFLIILIDGIQAGRVVKWVERPPFDQTAPGTHLHVCRKLPCCSVLEHRIESNIKTNPCTYHFSSTDYYF